MQHICDLIHGNTSTVRKHCFHIAISRLTPMSGSNGWNFRLNAHIPAVTPATHSRALPGTPRLTAAATPVRCPPVTCSSGSYMAGRQPCIAWCPAISNNGELPSAAAISEPPAETGEERSGRPRVTQRDASIRSRPRLTETGYRRNGGTDVPLTKGTPREQCRRRPQGHNGCEEDDRSSDPRFRSASTERQASVECEFFLTKSAIACPHQPGRCAVSDPARLSPDPRPGRRRGHSAGCTKTASAKPDPLRIRRRNAPHSAPDSENAAQVPNEAALASAAARQTARQGHQVASSKAATRSIRLVRGVLAALPSPAGPEMAGSRFPTIVNLPATGVHLGPSSAVAGRRRPVPPLPVSRTLPHHV